MALAPTRKITTSDVRLSREILLQQVSRAKTEVLRLINAGERNPADLRNALDEYIDFQTGADALGYTTSIEDRA